MKHRIAVENSLTPIRDFLSEKGYNVDNIDFSKEYSKGMDKYDAVVVTGLSENFLGVEDTNTKAVVIDAKGLTTEQVYGRLEGGLQ
ncbi:MAG: YkuS family protein [Ruminiclostridium sp.]|nr:YkuS family protein [Ruminiclostridium sp.]